MVRPVDFLMSYRFNVRIDGQRVGVANISEIKEVIRKSGKRYVKPIEIMAATKKEERSLVEILGKRPWQRHDVTLEDLDSGANVARVIQLKGCKFRGFRSCPRDAASPDVLVEWVKLHPQKIDIFTPKVALGLMGQEEADAMGE